MMDETGIEAISGEVGKLIPPEALLRGMTNTPNNEGGIVRSISVETPDKTFSATITIYTRRGALPDVLSFITEFVRQNNTGSLN